VVTGGTPAILARIEQGLETFDRAKIEGFRMSFASVQAHRERLWNSPLDLRQNIPGLPPDRADVILTGSAILERIMEALAFHELTISTRGFRFGALLAPSA
jgi:exopolyphosphatase/guanosine-5'-triphosphate,3'-diphosphate pyrophosphatase